MWQHRHTAAVVLWIMAGLARADFTESVWNDYFATERMAAECHSGSVERCHAVGVTPDEPSFWDYLTGKNRAKLLSVKANIRNTYSHFLNPNLADGDRSYLPYLATGDVSALTWTNEAAFLTACGLPTNALADTPWFKLQYTNTVGGWHTARICLSNMIVTKVAVDWTPNVWTNRYQMENTSPYEFNSLPLITYQYLLEYLHDLLDVDISRSMTNLVGRYYEFTSYYSTNINELIPSLPIPLPSLVRIYNPKTDPPTFWVPNARGSWTTKPDTDSWSTNYVMSIKGWQRAFANGVNDWPTNSMQKPEDYGIYWTNRLNPYMVKTRPRAIISAKGAAGEVWGEPYPVTNVVETNEVVYPQIETIEPIYDHYEYTVYTTNITTTTNDVYQTLTNYFTITNAIVSIVSSNAVTNVITELYISKTVTVAYAFGAAFVGTYLETNGYEYSMRGTGWQTNWAFVYETNLVSTNIGIPTNILDGVVVITETNIEYEVHTIEVQIGAETNWTDDLANPQTNTAYTTNVVMASNRYDVARYASGAVIVNGIPYVGAQDVYKQIGFIPFFPPEYPMPFPYTNEAAMSALYTGIAHSVDIYYQWTKPVNVPYTVPIWHGYKWHANTNHDEHASIYSTFAQSEDDGWVVQRFDATSNAVVFGETVFPNLNVDDNEDLQDTGLFEAMVSLFLAEFGSEGPEEACVRSMGREVATEWAAVWWNGTNGFKWK